MRRTQILAAGLALVFAAGGAAAQDHAGHDMPAMAADGAADHAMPGAPMHETQTHEASMRGALGGYPMTREASGTSWQPDASVHQGVHAMAGDWMLMGHVLLNGVYDHQHGPRGDDKAFAAGMVMGMASRQFANGDALQFRAMLSPDPLMGKGGYPLLLASGETADGVTPLIDRQHPHDLFMELSAAYSRKLTDQDSLFLYAGLPGEPAFGPPAFMHRLSIMDSPEAPISHHWLDSTHITYGVVTVGWAHGGWKAEASRFKGREPDESRFDIDNPRLDSTAARVSWNPSPHWSLQASWADVKSPEQLEPDIDQRKWSASAIHTRPVGKAGLWSTTAAWGRRSAGHDGLDAVILESSLRINDAWTLFGRGERTQNNELTQAGGHHGPTYAVGKLSAGAIHDWRLGGRVKLGLGGLYSVNFIPRGLEPAYGGDPGGAMAFVRLKIE